MADRWQSGTECYDDVVVAAQAHISQQQPWLTQFDFGEGIKPAFVVPQAAEPDIEGMALLVYELRDLDASFSTTYYLPYYGIQCALDAAVLPTAVTPSAVLTAFAFGLGAVLSFWALGYVIGLATGLIRKA